MTGFVTRFAPSPTGLLHLGHAYSALVGYLMACRLKGHFLLRIEDIDRTRCRPEFVEAIHEDLLWLGIKWEEPVLRQSQHLSTYRAVLYKLYDLNLIYPCFCSRKQHEVRIGAHRRSLLDADVKAVQTPDGALRYDGFCRSLSEKVRQEKMHNMPYAWRLDMRQCLQFLKLKGVHDLTYDMYRDPFVHDQSEAVGCQVSHYICHPELYGDVVIARKDVPTSYYLATSHDDAQQGITVVVRGRDLQPSTDIQRLLQVIMGWSAPLYYHHDLLYGPDGKKLSKTERSPSLRSMREQGMRPHDVIRLLPYVAKVML